MTVMTIPTKTKRTAIPRREARDRIQVMVHIETEVLDPEIARRKANIWLLETVGNLLGAENAELLLGESLRWRYDVVLGLPDLGQPGTGDLFRIGTVEVDAVTGDVINRDRLVEELHASAASVAR